MKVDFILAQMNFMHKKIKELRERANYTQRYVAEELGVDNATYSRIENGKIDITVSRLIKLASILHVSPEVLFANNANNAYNAKDIKYNAETEDNIEEITLRIKLSKDKKRQILEILLENSD
jgi:transcriptional regulator with XRE-family HTH domain